MGNSGVTPYPITLCTTFICGKPPNHLGPTNIPQHFISYFKFSIINTTVTLLLFFFFLSKPICEKAWAPKQIAAAGTTMVRKWKTHSRKHHPMQENKNPTLRNITSSLKNKNPLLLESMKSIIHLRFAVVGVLAWWLVNRNLTPKNTILNQKMKTHPCKTLIHC